MHKYSFNPTIENQLIPFKSYLQELGNSKNTIRQKSNYVGYFLKWLESEQLEPTATKYTDMLNFMDHCHLKSLSRKQINTILLSVRNFYDYLKLKQPELHNPAANLMVKGTIKKLPLNSIKYSELEQLYEQYPNKTNRDIRNKAMLGLLIYQGLTTEELHQLEPDHVELTKGKIHIPGNRKRNSRTLELNPAQILDLHEYVTRVRSKLNRQNSNQLLVSMRGKPELKNTLLHLYKAIKKEHHQIASAKQIRTSAITHWLKNHNLREVQYMAGHKYVSSTERYQLNNLGTLQQKLEKHHPLNKP